MVSAQSTQPTRIVRRLWGTTKTVAALCTLAVLATTAFAAEKETTTLSDTADFKSAGAEEPSLVRIALTNPDATPKDRATAQLQVLGLLAPNDFLRAIASGNQPLVRLFLTAGADVDARGDDRRTPLIAAALGRNWDLVARLLKAGANPRLADEHGLTPLMAAAIGGNVPTIHRLLAAGAPLNAMDSKGRLALGYAVALRQSAAVAALLDLQKTLPPAAKGGDDLAAAALESGDRDLLEDILRRLPDGLTWIPAARAEFTKALALRDTIMAPLLMEKFAGPPAESANSQPLLAYAVARHNLDQVRTLLFLGADPNTVVDRPTDTAFRGWVGTSFMRYYLDNTPGLTVLMLAAGLKQTDMVKLLLENGANRNLSTKGKSSFLALYFAAWANSPETIQVLLGQAPSKRDYYIEVSLDEQRVCYYRNGQLVLSSEISTGRDGYPTKPGEYVITDKHLEHHSTLYHNASMPYFMRLSCQAFGLHEGYVTGRPESHGCIRLPGEVARRLFKEAPIGTWVSVK
ncbi:ErfK/YbiS/YcfS/YnhG family protein [Chthoniobacter flavus Ellin428]|uniref:ErfK/YbiS/YcfS/YnhG family protein n=1 Tax=Chthoniobacter flavus Ellin428 TaxID=497964 RepID=B4CXC0_9BACT|nr:ankyrin repeat domain-containing protein [Chthoniobacter flavus]EDY20918.1 ErfK/YbiS/YcfS/YnhG family protein [Chthoniobacter flavus Ellin428]